MWLSELSRAWVGIVIFTSVRDEIVWICAQRRIAMMGKPYGTMSKVASVVFMLIASMACAVTAKEFTVGDTTGWDFAPNSSFYNDWANGLKFVPGDKIGKSIRQNPGTLRVHVMAR